jgi:hypothetical protein
VIAPPSANGRILHFLVNKTYSLPSKTLIVSYMCARVWIDRWWKCQLSFLPVPAALTAGN